jgi:diguanylate cyclase (GGDEF)-like protein
LTGLWNRRFADQTLNEELLRATRYGGSLALVLVDIDNFKQINDTYGHTVGDHVLMRVAGELQAACREVDRACRFGGEEFLLILPGNDEEGALFVAERVRTTVMGLPFLFADGRRTVTLSGGVIAFHPSPHCSQDLAPADLAHTLIHRADTGLYRAKAMGKNRMVVVSSKNVQKECRIFSRIQGR